MMSPRSTFRMGKSLASQSHCGVAKMNLLASRWSPIIIVFRMEADGIVNCCPTKVLKKMINSTAKQATSRLSRIAPLATPTGSS